jgi:quinol monooxygenase YgiN
MITATVRMAIPPRKREEALKIIRATAEECRIWPGCLSSRIYEDVEEANVLMMEERWRSQEDLEHHLRSNRYYKVLLVMEMALEQPEIRFDTITVTTGIETVERARIRGHKSRWQ